MSGRHESHRVHKGGEAGGTTAAAALFERVLWEVPGVVERLPDSDKTSLLAASWGALEAVVRSCDVTLDLDWGDAGHRLERALSGDVDHPRLTALPSAMARRLRAGQCRGQVRVRGVGVAMTDAEALVEALPRAYPPPPRVLSGYWVQFVSRLIDVVSETAAGPMRVTTLVMSGSGCRADEMGELRAVLARPAVRDNLRSLSLVVFDNLAAELHGSLRGMETLRRLTVHGRARSVGGVDRHYMRCSPALATLMCECAFVERVELRNLELGADTVEMVLDWLAAPTPLRHLRLDGCDVGDDALDILDRRFESGNPLQHLRVLDANVYQEWNRDCGPSTLMDCVWKDVPNLERLSLLYDTLNWQEENEAIAQMLRTTTALRRLDVGAHHVAGHDFISAEESVKEVARIVAALGDNKTVEVARFRMADDLRACAGIITAFAAALRSNSTLKELWLEEDWEQCSGRRVEITADEDAYAAAVQDLFDALGVNTSLETLVLPHSCGRGVVTLAGTFGTGMARNRTLRHLELPGTWNLSCDGVLQMARSIAHVESLRSLSVDLRDAAQVCALIDGLWGNKDCRSQLQRLRQGGVGLEGGLARKLADVLAHEQCTLQELDLEWTDFEAAGTRVLFEALGVNTSLVALNVCVRGNAGKFTEGGMMPLVSALQVNTTLRWMNLTYSDGRNIPPAVTEALKRVQAHVVHSRYIPEPDEDED